MSRVMKAQFFCDHCGQKIAEDVTLATGIKEEWQVTFPVPDRASLVPQTIDLCAPCVYAALHAALRLLSIGQATDLLDEFTKERTR